MSHRALTGAALALAAMLGSGRLHAANEVKRFPFDESAVHRLEVAHPRAAELFHQGEARLRDGDLDKAAQAFGKAASEAPQIGLTHRRHCQTLTELGRRTEAVAACNQALRTGGTPMDRRAMVGALMLGSGPPTAEEINQVIYLASLAKERLHDQPWGLAAECDIARRLRDEGAFKTCIDNLERVVPGHYETKRAQSLAPSPRPWLRWGGWMLLAGLVLLTAAHAGRRKLRNLRRAAAGAAALVVGSLFPTASVVAQNASAPSSASPPGGALPGSEHWQLSRWRINYDDPESSVPTPEQRDTNALEFGYHLQDLAAEGQKAHDKGDHRKAVKFWRALAKAAPDSNAGFFRACAAYEQLREREKAIEFCGRALTLPPEYHASEASRYARLVLSKEGRLNGAEINALDEVTSHLRQSKKPLAAFYAEQVQCDLAMKVDDQVRLASCSDNLVKLAPKDPRTITYQWALAMKRKDYDAAQQFLAQARTSSMKPEAILELERGIKLALAERRSRYLNIGFGVAGAILLVLLVVAGVRRLLARRRQAPAAPSLLTDPGNPPRNFDQAGGPHTT